MTNNDSNASFGWIIAILIFLAFSLPFVNGDNTKSDYDTDRELQRMEYLETKAKEDQEIEKQKREAFEDAQEWEERIDEDIEKGYLR